MADLRDLLKLGANDIIGMAYTGLTGEEPIKEFDTGYERTPGQEVYVKDTRGSATPLNNKTAYYNKTQAERGIIKALAENLSPYEFLATIMDEGTWASRLPYMRNATGDTGVGTQKASPSYFDYKPMAYHDYFSPIQHYIGDPLTEKMMLTRGYDIPWEEREARIPPDFDYAENLAVNRMIEGAKKYPKNQTLRLGNYQSNAIDMNLANRRTALTEMLKRNKDISNLIGTYSKGE